jgi:aldehyde:ferredoxin oxidoreductase
MLEDYYSLRGWDDKGRPRESTLKRLGLAGEPEGSILEEGEEK